MARRCSSPLLLIALGAAVGVACRDSTSVVILVPNSIVLAPTDTSVPQGASFQLRVTVYDTAGEPIPVRPTFASRDTFIVTVTTGGVVRTASSAGTAIIEARIGALADSTIVTVTDTLLGTRVPLAGRPYGAAISPTGVAYITQLDAGQLARGDLPSEAFAPAVTVGSVPTEVAFNSTGSLAYVTNQFSGNVGVIDVATNTQIDVIPVTGDPFEVIVAPGDSILYVTTNVDSVYGIRLATEAVVVAFAVPAIGNGLVVRDTLLYVSTHSGGTVVEFNLKTRTVSRTFTVGGIPQKMALSADRNTLYIANEAGYVQFWNLVTGAQIGGNLSLPPGSAGYGMARRPTTGQLYVTSAYFGGGNIHIINPGTRTLTRTIVAGGAARRVVFNASGSIGFVPNEGGWVDFLK